MQNLLLKQSGYEATTAELLKMLEDEANVGQRSSERLLKSMVADLVIEHPRHGIYRLAAGEVEALFKPVAES